MSENIIGLDIGTGFVKVVTKNKTFRFPSILAVGTQLELESSDKKKKKKDMVLVGDEAVAFDKTKSMTIKRPVYRGAPAKDMKDYMVLIKYAIDQVIETDSNDLQAIKSECYYYSDAIIVAGLPYNARKHATKIKSMVIDQLKPKSFDLIFQAHGTLIHEGLSDGIVCHIGHGTTEILVVINNKVAHGMTLLHGVGDISSALSDSKVSYVNKELYNQNNPELTDHRKRLAISIADDLQKVVIDFPGIPVILAGGGALIPKLGDEIKKEIDSEIRIAKEPIYGNAHGMFAKAEKKDNASN